MPLETGTYISDLVVTNPTGSDGKDKGDDHLRLIKATLKATYPNVTGAVVPTHTELNYLSGATSSIQSQINALTSAKGAISGQTWTGTHDYTSAVLNVATQTAGDSSPKAASTAFVAAQALAATLPAQTGNNGKGIATNGTTASWENFYPPIPSVQSIGFTAVSRNAYECNTTSAAFTLTLPASAASGDWILVTDYAGTFGTNNLTLARNGLNIMGLAEDMIVSSNYASFLLHYVDSTKGWLIK